MALTFFHPFLERDMLLGCGAPIRRQLASPEYRSNSFDLDLDIEEHPAAYIVSTDLPGFGEEDVALEVHQGVISIVAEKKVDVQTEGKEGKPATVIRKTRSFKRNYKLPDDVDEQGITATMDKGVLSLELPRRPAEAPRRIAVGGGKSESRQLTPSE
jgi:HSP20 family molecular chaperone IbpA